MKACPYCAEQIQDAAKICRFCQRDLPAAADPASATTRTPKPTARQAKSSNTVLKFALLVIGLIFLGWIGTLINPAESDVANSSSPESALLARKQIFNALTIDSNRSAVMKRYGVSEAELASIEQQAAREKWTVGEDLPGLKRPRTKPSGPYLNVAVTSTSYSHGYFKTVGTVENTGTEPARAPRIGLTVYGPDERTVLATDVAFPAGTLGSSLAPGQRAAFEHITRVPGEPLTVTYRMETGRHQGSVSLPGK